jgi:hypothetical protein
LSNSTFDTKLAQAVTADGLVGGAKPNTATSSGIGTPSFMDRARMLAWLRSTGRPTLHTQTKDGWKTLEMQLKNGDGLLKIQARQSKDHMAISVGFSDARLRAQAAASLNQLQESLQSQYDTPVDFSLMQDGSQDARQHDASGGSDRANRLASSPSSPETTEDDQPTGLRRPLAPGSLREWIG